MNLSLMILIIVSFIILIISSSTVNKTKLLLLFSKLQAKSKRIKTNLICYVNSFDFIKGVNYAAALPTLPANLNSFHNSLVGRLFRVIGGICAIILLINYIKLIDYTQSATAYILYITIVLLGLSQLFYIVSIFTIRFAYTFFYLITGKWIHRNSPLKWFVTEGSATFLCIKGTCFFAGGYFGLLSVASGLDHALGEDYFSQLAVIKEPALRLKMVSVYLQNHVTIGNPLYDVNLSETKPSKVLDKVRDLNELKKSKSSILNDPEVIEAFKYIKEEFKVDLHKEVQDYIQRLKDK